MRLPSGFTFTQTALRTYQDCPYCFRLRYIDRVPWLTFPLEPAAETAMERGRRFHELARQHFLGLDLIGQVEEAGEEVAAWWEALQAALPDLAACPRYYPEAGLSVPLGRFRLGARYDLLAVGEDAALVVDWKTGRDLPRSRVLAEDIQTRVYLYVLAEGGGGYGGGRPFSPEDLTLIYWHPRGPQQVRLGYSTEQREEDRAFLERLIEEIAARSMEEMAPVTDETRCASCAYAPLCGRPGGEAWEWEPEEDPFVGEVDDWLEMPV